VPAVVSASLKALKTMDVTTPKVLPPLSRTAKKRTMFSLGNAVRKFLSAVIRLTNKILSAPRP
jgi:hypothetical protein